LKSVVLLHDNACPHTSTDTSENLQKFRSDVMAHSPHNLDLTLSVTCLNDPRDVKGPLIHLRPRSDGAVHAWLTAQPKILFSKGIRKLVQQWIKCIEKQGTMLKIMLM
jgi:hypothetical protein